MHRFIPRLHIICVPHIEQLWVELDGRGLTTSQRFPELKNLIKTVIFEETKFFAVTAYQNHRCTTTTLTHEIACRVIPIVVYVVAKLAHGFLFSQAPSL
ncbi:hypothetical protein X801_09772 [Opisthorchis viverrini]|uniref:T-box domain-containing protein n=1 Tax=Opisthorchis viverrini TaxID=6198 RepID=A0A1S8WJ11_OPIVI|nr:hypothetical protein X801_09772 [Opisthorchis viverrini]